MGINHIVETGAALAGSWPTYNADTFADGFVVPPIKTGENLVQYTWWEQMWLRRTRTGVLNNLDDKMRLSGCAMVHDEIHKLIAEFGMDYYMRAIREVIEETHIAVRDNVRTTSIPGRYDTAGFRVVKYAGLMPLYEHADKDQLIHIRQRLSIDGEGTVFANMDGTSQWDYHAFNGYPGGADVAFYMAMINCFGYNTKPTSGVVLACYSRYPVGSVYNPGNITASFANIWAHSNVLNTLGFTSILRSFYARGFVEEALDGRGRLGGHPGRGQPAGRQPLRDGRLHRRRRPRAGRVQLPRRAAPPLRTVDAAAEHRQRGGVGEPDARLRLHRPRHHPGLLRQREIPRRRRPGLADVGTRPGAADDEPRRLGHRVHDVHGAGDERGLPCPELGAGLSARHELARARREGHRAPAERPGDGQDGRGRRARGRPARDVALRHAAARVRPRGHPRHPQRRLGRLG